jgi:hypothetical protein
VLAALPPNSRFRDRTPLPSRLALPSYHPPPLTRLCRYPTRKANLWSDIANLPIILPPRSELPARPGDEPTVALPEPSVTFVSTQGHLNQRTPGRSPRYFVQPPRGYQLGRALYLALIRTPRRAYLTPVVFYDIPPAARRSDSKVAQPTRLGRTRSQLIIVTSAQPPRF